MHLQEVLALLDQDFSVQIIEPLQLLHSALTKENRQLRFYLLSDCLLRMNTKEEAGEHICFLVTC